MGKSVTVIGAGPGGLAAAMLLARQGRRVRILERLDRVGGRCSAIESDGFRFDTGPTFFLYPRVLQEIFAACGSDLFERLKMTRLDPQYRVNFGAGGYLDATSDPERMEAEISRLSPSDAGRFAQFMAANRTKLKRFRPILESPFSSVLDLLRPSSLQAVPWLRPWHSVGSELQTLFSDPRLTIAFSFQSKYLGMSPFQCPSLFTILAFLEYEYGVWHPEGGCSAVSECMAGMAQEMGVEIHLNEPVEQLSFQGRRVTEVSTSRRSYRSDAIVINSDFARTMTRLIPNRLRRRWNDDRISRTKFSCSTFMMYLGIEGLEDTKHHTIHIAEDYGENLKDIEQRHVLSADPSFYVQNAGVTDSTLAPAGTSTLYVLVPVTNQHPNVDWNEQRPKFRQQVLAHLEKIGIRNVEQRIRYEKIITPDDWDTSYEVHNGATFNMAHNLGQMLHKRPHNRFEDLHGVYLVGGGTHPGSGLPVIYESARITSQLMQRDLGTVPGAGSRRPTTNHLRSA